VEILDSRDAQHPIGAAHQLAVPTSSTAEGGWVEEIYYTLSWIASPLQNPPQIQVLQKEATIYNETLNFNNFLMKVYNDKDWGEYGDTDVK